MVLIQVSLLGPDQGRLRFGVKVPGGLQASGVQDSGCSV